MSDLAQESKCTDADRVSRLLRPNAANADFPVTGPMEHVAYRILGVHSPSETGEAYLIVSNDRDEIWFISNRHFRTWELRPDTNALRVPLSLGAAAGLDTSHLSH